MAGIGAATGAFALTLQFVTYNADSGGDVLASAWRLLGFFTILTNILITAICARAVLSPRKRDFINAPRIEAAGLTSIALVSLVYHTLLAGTWSPEGARLLADILLHSATPLIFLAFWLARPHGSLRLQDALICSIFPLGYVAYALIRGAFEGWYPYGFIDASSLGVFRLIYNIMCLAIMFVIGAVGVVAIDREVARRAP